MSFVLTSGTPMLAAAILLPDRDPGAAQARVAQAEVHEQRHRHEDEREPVERSETHPAVELLEPRYVDRVDRRDRLAAGGELGVVGDRDLVAVDGEAVDDLAEGQG